MIVCPSCGSSRIRNDYKPAPLALRVIGVRALLCDHCNRQFRAFSPVAPKSRAPRQTRRKADVFNPAPEVHLDKLDQTDPQQAPAEPIRINLSRYKTSTEPQPAVTGELVSSIRRDLRTEITKLYEEGAKQAQPQNAPKQVTSGSAIICPDCGSQNVRRRHRTTVERAVLSVTDHKAFACRDCKASFYARTDDDNGATSLINSSDAALM
jgi:transposase-like protein